MARKKRNNKSQKNQAKKNQGQGHNAGGSSEVATLQKAASPSAGQSPAQKRASHALGRIHALVNQNYGNYPAYVKSLPAKIIMNGLGQALAVEKGQGKDLVGHELLFGHMQDWLLHGWESSPYKGQEDILIALCNGSEEDYIRAQGEAMAYIEWLKKFAVAYLKSDDDGGKNEKADTGQGGGR